MQHCLPENVVSPPQAKNPEFTAWLREVHGRFFNELETDDARALFAQFVAAWNARKLPARYYVGMAGRAMKRTQHNWGIQLGALQHGYHSAASGCNKRLI